MIVLVLKGKHGDALISMDDPEAAWLKAFELRDSWGMYSFALEVEEQIWRDAARVGDARAAQNLIDARNGWEYESYDIDKVITP